MASIHTRQKVPDDKADNKRFRKVEVLDSLPQEEKEAAYLDRLEKMKVKGRLDKLREKMPLQGASMSKQVLPYARLAAEEGVGNCLENAAIAYAYLTKATGVGRSAVDIVYLSAPGDHVFVAIGQKHGDGRYPDDFGAWEDTAVICDPWADIVCLARDYPTAWRARMDEWASEGREVASMGRGWIAPTDSIWYGSVENCEKWSYSKPSPK